MSSTKPIPEAAISVANGSHVCPRLKKLNFSSPQICVSESKKKIKAIDPDKIRSVNGPRATKGVMIFRIKAKMTAEDFAMYLVEDDWAAIIEIVDLKPNRIQAKKVGS